MRKITEISEIQELLLLMLKYFDTLCREHGLSYVMLGGTMLGAVRPKGFIPWDDDVDVGMPRPDYARFLSLMETEKGRYFCVTREKDPADPHLFAKLVDSRTKAVERLAAGVENYGLFIDVFPVDGLGKIKEEALKTAEGVFC
jgi:lipopolysaccharide cholinephosphotransferase